ncbi:MAG: 5'-nucleotidase C-terminal domain-containing protein [Ancrocorticia sp.]|uniref:5'-nucleotidase C-terminal domain-containing protein n=1 Tax=Ancrocorticia sp. TaxID=2593684 RepID=UPI003F9281A2
MAISDFHGHIENAPYLQTYVKGVKADNPNTLFVSNGDSVGGSAFVSAIDEDNPTMDILNAMDVQLSATGNHEFDKGYDDLIGRINDRVNFPYLVSNLSPVDADILAPYDTIETADGQTVAFVGAVTDQLPTLVSPAGLGGRSVSDPVAAVDAQAELLKDGDESNGEADIVVALIHETIGTSDQVGDDVDAVIAGHTHHTEESTTASGAAAVEPGSFGEFAGQVTLTYDNESGEVTNSESQIVMIVDTTENDKPVPQFDKDPDIDAMYQEALKTSEELGAGEAGTIVGGADRATNTGTDLGANRGSEMTAGNLIAQAFYEYSELDKPADFGIINPGGVRGEIDKNNDGIVTYEESFTAQPFGNTYGTLDITGAQVYTMLEQQWADASTQTSRPMLALGLSDNISYTYDADAEFGSHIKQVFLDNMLVPNDGSEMYTVASNAFLLTGGDGFNVFADGVDYRDSGMIDNDVFNEFLQDNPDYTVDYSQRNIAISGEDTIYLGQTASIDLQSLSMTYAGNQQPLPETVDVSLIPSSDAPIQARAVDDAVAVGTAPIDNTVTPDLNETGQSTVELEVPADLEEGSYALVIEAGPTVFQIPGVAVSEEPAPEPTDEATDKPTDGTSQPSDGATDPGEDLPNTGATVAGFIVAALVLMTAGGVLVARRKSTDA